MYTNIFKPALALSLLAVGTSGALAEPLGDPDPNITDGPYSCPPTLPTDAYTFYEPNGINYQCSDATLPDVLVDALAGDAADPGGYVKLLPYIAILGSPTGPICVDGTFPATGDTLEVCTPTLAEWTTEVDGEVPAETYFNTFFDTNPGLYDVVAAQYGECLDTTDPDDIAADIYADFVTGLPLFSNPAITYIDQAANGAVSIGLAQAFDATPAYAQALKFAFSEKECPAGFSLDLSGLQGFQLQFTEGVKITFNDEEPVIAASFQGSQTGRFQDDSSCVANLALYAEINEQTLPELLAALSVEELEDLKLQICSGSGNYEIVFTPPQPGSPAPIPAVSGLGLAFSALGMGVLGWRRVGSRRRR